MIGSSRWPAKASVEAGKPRSTQSPRGFFASAPVTGGPQSAKSPAWRQLQVGVRGDLILVTQRIDGAFSGDEETPKEGD